MQIFFIGRDVLYIGVILMFSRPCYWSGLREKQMGCGENWFGCKSSGDGVELLSEVIVVTG